MNDMNIPETLKAFAKFFKEKDNTSTFELFFEFKDKEKIIFTKNDDTFKDFENLTPTETFLILNIIERDYLKNETKKAFEEYLEDYKNENC